MSDAREGGCACGPLSASSAQARSTIGEASRLTSIYTKSKVGWVVLPDGAPAFDEYYDSKTLWPATSLERLSAVLPSRA